jgi:hypothetical protein
MNVKEQWSLDEVDNTTEVTQYDNVEKFKDDNK